MRLSKKVPETTTAWIVSSFSLDPVTGLAIAQTSLKIEVEKPISVGFTIPPSVKRGEVLSISIAVTSRIGSSTSVEVTLHNQEQDFDFVDVADKGNSTSKLRHHFYRKIVVQKNPNCHTEIELYRRKRVTVKSNEASALTFLIRPKRVTLTTIKVTATTSLFSDNAEQAMSIEAEGVAQKLNTAILVDLRNGGKMEGNLTLEIPRNAVPESIQAELSVLSDIMGSTIRNLGSLIDKPTGCGEQNLLDMVSNVIVLNYLKRTNQLNEQVEANAVRLIETGYQRELSYRHPDGSFSAFGDTDRTGSTWVTAFVVSSFLQSSQYISVEKRIVDEALDWLKSNQALNGGFPEVGNINHNDMQGTSNNVALTAYTLMSFLESKTTIPAHRNAVNKAMDYIARNLEGLDDLYALAVAAYALQIADHNAKDYVLRILDSRAIVENGKKFWKKPVTGSDTKNVWYKRPNSVNTEITAYGLLAVLASGAAISEALPIVNWLVGQRSENGGYSSTQDTLVGLLALSKATEVIPSRDINIQVNAKYGKNLETNIRVASGYSKVPPSYEVRLTTKCTCKIIFNIYFYFRFHLILMWLTLLLLAKEWHWFNYLTSTISM